MDTEFIDIAQHSIIKHINNVLNDFRPRILNNKQFGGNYNTTHAEINLLFKLGILTSKLSRCGYNKKSKNLPNKYINKYNRKLPKIIYIIRVDAKGKLMYSRPCSHCLIVLKRIGIKYAIYSVDRYSFIKEKLI